MKPGRVYASKSQDDGVAPRGPNFYENTGKFPEAVED